MKLIEFNEYQRQELNISRELGINDSGSVGWKMTHLLNIFQKAFSPPNLESR